jgi:two-component system OmpR family response regulator
MQVSDKKIWILEDSFESRQIFEEILELRFGIKCFENLLSFESHWLGSSDSPDLVIVDLRLPDGNFLNFIKSQSALKRVFPPFIVISSVDDLDIMRAAFQYGALDYLVKPFRKTEILVKIERLLKSTHPQKHDFEETVTIDPIRMLVKKEGSDSVKLTTKELQIFTLLYESKEKKVSRTDLFRSIWEVLPSSEKTLDVHISNIRQKVNKLGLEICYTSPETYMVLPLRNTGSVL